ncbi:MAG: EscU/YscU/HrcU family type III secretion system export apparatus switch protein [Rhodothermales bacterium]|nr:EscU/YscU/HrcU family type III secretion system export apparatus switch protein [Rhodothermales bacterium]MBO6780440.1 EscU/YscU/HrcU family type III secretion system export apparatus switch protein [Rhodothermales bacterium]
MADRSDKIFDPTPQRLKKAREDGNLFKSQDVTSIALLLAGMTMITAFLPRAFESLKLLSGNLFLASATTEVNLQAIPGILQDSGMQVVMILGPFVGVLFITSVGIQAAQSGLNLTMKPLEPKPDKISPLKGLQRIFSAQGAFNTGKAVLKIAVVGPVAWQYIAARMEEILMLPALTIEQVMAMAGQWMMIMVFQLLIVLILLSAIDAAFEKWRYKRDLKMSKQEIKDENRESQGDPHVKSRRRQLAMEMKRRPRLDHAILKADVVVTNPTHFAVMLRYNPEESPAPLVLAKGVRKRALRIKALAREFDVPMVEDRPLARALYHTVEEMAEIPADLYPAVATILAEIYRQQQREL